MPLPRRVQPELLDTLPPEDPEARRSRRDLRRVNALMGHPGLLARLLRRHLARPPRRILEIGAGDGAASLALARRLAPRWPEVRLALLDRQRLVDEARIAEFSALGWQAEPVVADVFEHLRDCEPADAVVANLFLHHFDDRLAELLAAVAQVAPVFVAAEPRRDRVSLAASRLLGGIGANRVTRHDAAVSVRAGFRGGEIGALWPRRAGDRIREGRGGPFTHAFAAARSAP